MKKIVILGAGDFAKELAWLIEDINAKNPTYEILGFLDDDDEKLNKEFNGYRCIGKINYLEQLAKEYDVCATIATQESKYRKKFVQENSDFKKWETLIHPTANIANTSKLGVGCIVCANCIISVNTNIGDHCILNLGVTIGHDCQIDDYVSFMSGVVISGHATIKESAYFGSNSTVVPSKKIGENARVGAGSVVIRNVKDDTTVIGVPAKILRV